MGEHYINSKLSLSSKMERIAQKDKPLPTVAHISDLVIIEKEVDGKVVDRQVGFLLAIDEGRVSLTRFDHHITPETLRRHGLSKEYPIPEIDMCPSLEDITHYYIVPSSLYKR